MDDANALELAGIDLYRLTHVMHRQGLSYEQILLLLLNECENLVQQITAEHS